MGEILAPITPKTWDGIDPTLWISFSNVYGLSIRGSGTFNGRGSGWWNQAIKLLSCNKTSVRDVKFVDSPQTHLLAFGCNGVCVNNVSIRSPGDSPNTDGIHLQSTQHVRIRNSNFSAGDDCISIGDHTSDIVIDNINCGPGHGISIGSLGKDGSYVEVEDIHVSNVSFEGTTNGARIKTWQVCIQ
ncbi:hypothetical protein Scep_008411 [Stephania cephalantha]|uniref:Polygalacturonase n=1 Tax=Stephania cephalantha TaxID=152367 RepID=A0AAP0KDP7_9MAGN